MRLFVILLGIFCSTSLFGADAIGKVIAVDGVVTAISGSTERTLTTNSDIFIQELIRVTDNARAQIQFTDGGLLNLISGTEFRVNTYKFKKFFEKDQSSSQLIKGGFRLLSGGIAKSNPNAFEIKTPSATIGLRGTIVEAAIGELGLFVGVELGKAEITNNAGALLVGAGEPTQFVRISSPTFPPEALPIRPTTLERTLFEAPTGGISIDEVASQQKAAPTTKKPASTGTKAAPTDSEAAPTDSEAAPTDSEAAPTDSEAAPTDSEAAPTDTETTPIDAEAAPTDTDLTPTTTEDDNFDFDTATGGASIQGGC